MKILVTGGAGFIGSHLVEKLVLNKNEVTVIDNLSTGRLLNMVTFIKKIKFIKKDINQVNNWDKILKKIDLVYHLAALADVVPSIENPEKYFEANVVGTKNILQACKKFKVKKIIYTASSSCYGIPKNFPTKENEIISCMYPYALTKKIGEDLVLHYSQTYKLNCISLRLFNVYGPRSRTSGTYGAMFGVFLKQKLANKPLTVVGDGSQKRDFTFVTDVVDALIKSQSYKGKYKIFNIGSGEAISINRIVKLMKSKKIYIPKRPAEPDITQADNLLAKKELKWSPKIKINDGINILFKNISYWKKAPLWTPKKIKLATKIWFETLQ